jgi:putative Holliday junction resolvase
MQGRVLAVDPGSKRIGLAISDPMRIIASPLAVIKHISMTEDCERIREFCSQN